jgi:outer membrane immunogenic protein
MKPLRVSIGLGDNMLRFGFLSVLFALGMTTATMAGPAPSSLVNWSGAYLGATLGYGWTRPTYNYEKGSQVGFTAGGVQGGILGGYNFQSGNFVYGVEGDFTLTDMNKYEVNPSGPAPCYEDGCDVRVDWYGTLRGRLGYSFNSVMPFITGGLAVGRVKGDADLGACGYIGYCGFKDTRAGWTLGAGAEWKINPKWSVKAEYLYVNLGKPHFNENTVTADDIAFSNARIGVSYHF